uniref:Tetratricopeptide repeat protein 17 n=1 Tax=Dendroctonus ponderosae TaxID=77166 RepID=A0AAR5PZ19_DENPD
MFLLRNIRYNPDTLKVLLWAQILFSIFAQLGAVNHWIVTQSGKIQAFLDSPFDLRKPDDLLALLDQESRKNDIHDLYEDLLARKTAIEKKWIDIDKNSNVASKVTSEDVDCLAAHNLYGDVDFYNIATNGSDRGIVIAMPKKINMGKVKASKELKVPLCMQLTPARWSESLINKTDLTIQPEEALRKTFLPVKFLEQFVYYIVKSLKQNSTSWVHYNLASFYWRIKGEGDKAIDCLKLAIQFVTGNFEDIPLHNLAGILHQSRHSKEAIQILYSAIEFAPKEPKHYLAMANIYAALRDFNSSISYYEKFLELDPHNQEAASNRHAVLCYYKLETALTSFQSELQNILAELHDYHSVQQQWLRLQERLKWETASFDYQYEAMDLEIIDTPKKVQRCMKKSTGGKPVISCDFYEKAPKVDRVNLQSLFQIVENEKQKLIVQHPLNLHKEEIGLEKLKLKERPIVMGYPKFPISMPIKYDLHFDKTGWPTKEECLEWNLPLEEEGNLHLPVFLPPDNKGYLLKKAITDDLNLPNGTQHELPWYPPICESPDVNGEKFLPFNERHQLDVERKSDGYLKKTLLEYVNEGYTDKHEIGQRNISAMDKKTAPRWVLATLASLYWRIRGNMRKTLDCLDMAYQSAPKEHMDVVWVSLGSTVKLLGMPDQSLKFANSAFKINYIEPATNFLLALLKYEDGDIIAAMNNLKNILRADPGFYNGMAEKLLKVWSCRIKLGTGPINTEVKQPLCTKTKTLKGGLIHCDEKNMHCKHEDIECVRVDKQRNSDIFEQCKDSPNMNLGDRIMTTLAAAEIRDDDEHSRSLMGLSLGGEHFLDKYKSSDANGDFNVSLAENDISDSEPRLNISHHDQTHLLSTSVCQRVNLLQPFKYSQLWEFIKFHMIDIEPYLNAPSLKTPKDSKPNCIQMMNPHMSYRLDEVTLKVLGAKLPNVYDRNLTEFLQLICGSRKSNARELGVKISEALALDSTNWKLLMASAIYWIVYGNMESAAICIRSALAKVPTSHLDIPLTFFSHLLANAGWHQESLEMAYLAVTVSPQNVWNHFRVAEMFIKLGKFEDAVPYLKASLQENAQFFPAQVRLKAVLCKLLFEDGYNHGSITAKIVDD